MGSNPIPRTKIIFSDVGFEGAVQSSQTHIEEPHIGSLDQVDETVELQLRGGGHISNHQFREKS